MGSTPIGPTTSTLTFMQIVIDKPSDRTTLSELEPGDAFFLRGSKNLCIVINSVSSVYCACNCTDISVICFAPLGPFYHQYRKDTKIIKIGKIRVVAD